MSNIDFSIHVLRERAKNYPRKCSPYCKKIEETIEYLIRIKPKIEDLIQD
jgi:hypothetical protein